MLCGKFISEQQQRHHAKYCSRDCLAEAQSQRYHKAQKLKYHEDSIPTSASHATIGVISELRVTMDLLKRGYEVYKALNPSCTYGDLTVLRDHKLLRIEVRTAHRTATGKIYNYMSTKKDYDILALVLPDEIIYEPAID